MRIGPWNHPIEHVVDKERFAVTNIALEGHPYAGGKAMQYFTIDKNLTFDWGRGFFMREAIYLNTSGFGPNSEWYSERGNEVLGEILFERTHFWAPLLIEQYLGGE